MFVHLEQNEKHSIESYTNQSISIQGQTYTHSCFISQDCIRTDWPIHSIQELTEASLTPLLKLQPEIILIGHHSLNTFAPRIVTDTLMKQNIALETMPIGAACRTFNILLSEKRPAILGIIFNN